jgi:hypothetical protein
MGRQIYFYFSDEDQRLFAQELDQAGLAVGLRQPTTASTIRPVQAAEVAKWHIGEFDALLFQLQDLQSVVTRRSGNKREYLVDIDRSPVIQFHRCVTRDQTIISGRLYYHAVFFDQFDQKYEKPKEFISWAGKVFRMVKRHGYRNESGYYVGRGAKELLMAGYAFRELA